MLRHLKPNAYDGSIHRRRRSLELDEDEDNMQLGQGILVRNLGLDVVVVVTKVRKQFLLKNI